MLVLGNLKEIVEHIHIPLDLMQLCVLFYYEPWIIPSKVEYGVPWIKKRIQWKASNRKQNFICLYGSWNGFRDPKSLEYQGKQVSSCAIKKPPGVYAYRLLVNDKWKTDDMAPTIVSKDIKYNLIEFVDSDSDNLSDQEYDEANEEIFDQFKDAIRNTFKRRDR